MDVVVFSAPASFRNWRYGAQFIVDLFQRFKRSSFLTYFTEVLTQLIHDLYVEQGQC